MCPCGSRCLRRCQRHTRCLVAWSARDLLLVATWWRSPGHYLGGACGLVAPDEAVGGGGGCASVCLVLRLTFKQYHPQFIHSAFSVSWRSFAFFPPITTGWPFETVLRTILYFLKLFNSISSGDGVMILPLLSSLISYFLQISSARIDTLSITSWSAHAYVIV